MQHVECAIMRMWVPCSQAARRGNVLLWCWIASVGAGVIRRDEILLSARRMRASYDMDYELCLFDTLLDEAFKVSWEYVNGEIMWNVVSCAMKSDKENVTATAPVCYKCVIISLMVNANPQEKCKICRQVLVVGSAVLLSMPSPMHSSSCSAPFQISVLIGTGCCSRCPHGGESRDGS